MNRPMYKTNQHAQNADQIARLLQRQWRCSTVLVDDVKYGVNYAVVINEKVKAFVEIKCRTTPKMKYSTYMISARKVERVRRLAASRGKPAFLVISWTDEAGYINFNEEPTSVTVGGRRDRYDSQDTERVFLYDVANFRTIRQ